MMWPRFLAQRAIRSLGYEVRRVPKTTKLPIEPLGTDPVSLEYCLSKRGFAIFDIPVEDCRAFHSLALRLRPEDHPFVRAFVIINQKRSAEGERAVIERTLASYYDLVRPSSACDVTGLSEEEAPGLAGVQPIGYILPWWEKGVFETKKGRERSLRYIGMRYGISTTGDAGYTFFGPVQPAKLALQVMRLDQLLSSARRQGFKPFAQNFPPKVVALRHNGEYRWLIDEGQHRFALGSALGVQSIPAMVTNIVRREDARLWPQVVSGVFTEAGAVRLFDRLFGGEPASVCSDWIKSER